MSEAAHESFDELKGRLTMAPILGYPDPEKTYVLDIDASAFKVRAILSQEEDGREHVVFNYNKSLSATEHNYCIICKELLAIVKAVKHFRPYLYGRLFKLRMNHASILWLCPLAGDTGIIPVQYLALGQDKTTTRNFPHMAWQTRHPLRLPG